MQKLKPHKTAKQIADKHGVDVSVIHKQLKIGIPIEHEHTKDNDVATDIALQHLDEIPDYYTRLKKMEKSASSKKEVKEENVDKKYCALCDKVETRAECSYGGKAWDAVTSSESVDHSISDRILEKFSLKGPCWKGYKQIGMKKKNGKNVPNCVPENFDVNVEEGYKNLARKAGVMTQKAAKLGVQSGASKMGAHALETGGLRNAIRNKLGLKSKKRENSGAEELKSKSKKYAERAAKIVAVQQGHKPGVSQETEKINREKGRIKNIQKLNKIYQQSEDVTIEDLNGNTFVNITDVVKAEPIKGFKSQVKEATLLKSQSGNVIHVTLSWRGKYYGLKLFFPQIKTPTKKEIDLELQKVYPGCVVIHYYISDMQPGQPLIQPLGPQGGSSTKLGPNKNYIRPMSEQ